MREEALYGGIVITIAPARHADLGANLGQHVVVKMRRVRGSTVTVNDHTRHVFSFAERFLERLLHEFFVRVFSDLVGDNFVIKQILDCGEIEPTLANSVLRDVRYPLFVRFVGFEMLVEYIFCDESGCVCGISVPALFADSGLNPELLHESEYFLVIHPDSTILPQKELKLAVPVNAVVFPIDGMNKLGVCGFRCSLLSL